MVARGALRVLLGHYLACDPRRVRFRKGAQGKPYLEEGSESRRISFNMSHSGKIALYALTPVREIGVDIELVRPHQPALELAERFFARGEVAALRVLPEREREGSFFACWTRKEAYLKATGMGLSTPLDRFEVSIDPDDTTVRLTIPSDPAEAARWSLHGLRLIGGYASALAVEDNEAFPWHLTCREFLHAD